MRIFCLHDGGSGCQYYRMQLPLEELSRHDGYEVTFADVGDTPGEIRPPTITLRDLTENGYNVLVGQRLNKHDGMGIWRRAWAPDRKLVYDLDDDVWNVGVENFAAHNLYAQGAIQDAVEHSAQVADLITVTTDYLAGVMTERTGNASTAVLPNCIPGWVCDTARTPHDRPTVGWQGGASHGLDIGLVTQPVRRFIQRFPGWDLQLCGTDFRPSFRVPKEQARYRHWIQVNNDPQGFYAAMDFDIGLAPLAENAFSMAKSAIKLLEYGARGIPVIASDVGPYRDYVQHGITGFLVRRDHEWLGYLSELASDEKLRETMGAAGRELAREHTIEKNWRRWAAAYGKLFTRL